MSNYKMEVFTIKNSFSVLHETENMESILTNVVDSLKDGVVMCYTETPNNEEMTIVPREKVEYIKVTSWKALNLPSNSDNINRE
jgi:hypothetical protein